jgi:ubiquitin-conjugating enzyme E2 variant
MLLLTIFIAILLADFITGFFHWFEDSYLPYCTKFPIFRDIAKDNVLHHYFPRAMLAYSNLEHCHYSLPATILIALLLFLKFPVFLKRNAVFILVLFVFVNMANIIHSWAHMRKCELNPLIAFLQEHGLLQSHEYHRVHHRTGNARFCVITPLLNSILDNVRFWSGIETTVHLCTGVKPSHVTYDDFTALRTDIHKKANAICPRKPNLKDVHQLRNSLKKNYRC